MQSHQDSQHAELANHRVKECIMLIIDRFEGNYAVVEINSEMISIPKSVLPSNAKEGDVLKIIIDDNETDKRKKHIENLMNKVFKD